MVKMEGEEFEENLHKEASVQLSKPKNRNVGHYFVHIPKEIIRELEIEKGDMITFDIPLKNKNKYTIKFKKLR